MRMRETIAAGLAAGLLMGAAGCRFDRHKNADDHSDNVKFATPFGGLSVKTNQDAVQGSVGISTYPGASLIKKENGNDSAADVNFSLGSIHVGVKALSYQSADAADKVMAFYRKDLAHYGLVLLCRGHATVGTPVRTQEGLTCDSESKGVRVNDEDDADEELKAGSRQHQHIVGLRPNAGGTKISLVALDLPGKFDDEDSKQ